SSYQVGIKLPFFYKIQFMSESPIKLKDLICFAHHRWNFIYHRPQHLMSRFAKCFRVFYIEEPVFNALSDHYEISLTSDKVIIVVPHLQYDHKRPDVDMRTQGIIDKLFA